MSGRPAAAIMAPASRQGKQARAGERSAMPQGSQSSARFASLTPVLAARSIAIVGASDEPDRIGGRPIAYMLAQNYAGAIMPVNPRRATVQGLRAYASVAELPEVPDVGVVAVPAGIAVDAVSELAARGTKGIIVFTAGFAEMDAAGEAAQARMVAAARAHGARLLGPNCLGLFNARIGYYPTFSAAMQTGYPRPDGRIGIASQSGAYGTHLFVVARDRDIGASLCVTTGNEADVTIGDVIGWLAEDDGTDVIAVYAEGIREAASFLAALATARDARKPVVLMKVGRSALGGQAARSHTASIAGNDAVTEAVLAEFGVVRARSTEEMLDIAYAATRRIYPAANTLGVITISGGAGVLISDAAETLGLAMPEMPQVAQERLKALLPFSAPRNPVDCTAQAINDPSLIREFAGAMVTEGGYASVLAFFTQIIAAASGMPLLRELAAIAAAHPDRLYVMCGIGPPEIVRQWEAAGYLVFADPTRATVAIHAMGRFGAAFARAPTAPPPSVPAIALPPATPSEAAAKRLLAQAGIGTVPERACVTVEEAVAAAEAFGYPVVMKILSPDILHKTEIGGVLLDVADTDAVRRGHATLLERAGRAAPAARLEGVLVARQLRGGVECIMGINRDPVFGPVAVFGLGGVFVEVLKDVVFRRCPFGEDVAREMIGAIRGLPLLRGARGRKPADIAALARMLARLSVFAAQAGPALRSIDLNPVFAMPEGEGAYAADAVIDIGE